MSDQHSDRMKVDSELDALLNTATVPAASDALRARILDDHAHAVGKASGFADAFDTLWERLSARRFIPAGALAGLGALGFATGLATAASGDFIPSEDEALYYADAALGGAFTDSEEDALWAVD